jgi:hypothetical protein
MVLRIKVKLSAREFVELTIWLCCYHKHKTTRFPNHMNRNKLSFKSKSWDKKIKSKNTMCTHDVNAKWLYYKNLTRTKQGHDKDTYPKLMLNKMKIMHNSTLIYTD